MAKIVAIGKVLSVYDDMGGNRIQVQLPNDTADTSKLPYCYPLLPVSVRTAPKVNESVLVIFDNTHTSVAKRYYIGPIVTQPQYNDFEDNSIASEVVDGNKKPLSTIDNYKDSVGAYPEKTDVSLVGRESEDIILKKGEIDLRCGIRDKILESENIKGYVAFNSESPSYVQLKYEDGLLNDADSVVNLVADKINIVSHKDPKVGNLAQSGKLIGESERSLEDIMKDLHQLPYGDLLVEALTKIRAAVLNHSHPYASLPPCRDVTITALEKDNYKKILSKHVRIS